MTAKVAKGVECELATLAELDRAALLQRWRRAFGRDAPPRLSRVLMEKAIAYDLQAKVFGGLSARTRRSLEGHGEGGWQVGSEQTAQPRHAAGS